MLVSIWHVDSYSNKYSNTVPPELKIFFIFFFAEVLSSTDTHSAASKQDPSFGPHFKILVQIHLGEMVS